MYIIDICLKNCIIVKILRILVSLLDNNFVNFEIYEISIKIILVIMSSTDNFKSRMNNRALKKGVRKDALKKNALPGKLLPGTMPPEKLFY